MGLASYLPSAQFSVTVTSILLAGGLIWAADYYTSSKTPSSITSTETPSAITTQGMDWKAALVAIQGETQLPEPPSQETVAGLLSASETDNITATVGRSILITLGEAKAQGLGSDIPTQERIVENALTKLNSSQNLTLYTSTDLITAPDSQEVYMAYGNGMILVLERYPQASVEAAFLAVGNATDTGDTTYLAELAGISTAYRSIARDMASLVVPSTLSPIHLQVVNNFAKAGAAAEAMRAVLSDPLLGLAGLKDFQLLTDENSRLFINIAQVLNKNGILFSEDEPGSAWSLLAVP